MKLVIFNLSQCLNQLLLKQEHEWNVDQCSINVSSIKVAIFPF